VTDFNKIKEGLTHERLRKYAYDPKTDTTYNDEEIFKRYHFNMELSGELNKAIHVFEVILRNSIVNEWNIFLNDTLWPSSKNRIPQSKKYQDILDDINKAQKRLRPNSSNDDLVAALTLGFWKKIFSSKFDVQNKKIVKKIFPNKDNWKNDLLVDLSDLQMNIEIVWKLRNRIAHHEPVFHRKTLNSEYDLIIEMIRLINKESIYLLKENQFKNLLKNGWS
jgi:hypothetical protein